MDNSLVIIPTFNERDNVENIIRAVMKHPENYHVLIVDDGSPDGTADIVRKMIVEFAGRVHLEERTGKLGLGTAYIHGFKWGLRNNYDFIFEMDADFSHDPNDLPRLLEACKPAGVGMSVGSRYTSGGKLENWPLKRQLLSQGASVYVRVVMGLPVKDPTAGFVCYKNETLSNMNLDSIRFVGYSFQIEMKYAVWRLGYKIAEVPITFRDRTVGESKMSSSIVKEALSGVWSMNRFKSNKRDYRKK